MNINLANILVVFDYKKSIGSVHISILKTFNIKKRNIPFIIYKLSRSMMFMYIYQIVNSVCGGALGLFSRPIFFLIFQHYKCLQNVKA